MLFPNPVPDYKPMLDSHKLPLLIGVSLLLSIPVGIGAFAYSSLRNEDEPQQTTNPSSPTESYGSSERNFVPPAPVNNGGSVEDHSEGIPIGKYSNPPTKIRSYGEDTTSIDRSWNDSGSVERNRAIQQNAGNSVPDYSQPASSNNFNQTEDNSLVTPLEDDILEVPQDDDEETPGLSVTEPLLSP